MLDVVMFSENFYKYNDFETKLLQISFMSLLQFILKLFNIMISMNKKIIGLPLLLACPLLLTSAAKKQTNRPNVLIILLDDAGYNDFGFMGSKDMKSPKIDELASQSTLLTNAHVTASVSGPSRAGLLTGRYQQRYGAECNFDDNSGLALNEKTIADVFKSNGYKTSCIGKWHMGTGSEYHPNKRGFDHFYGFLAGARSYFYDEKTADKPGSYQNLQLNGVQQKFDGYLTDVLSNEAIRIIQQTNDPFMMYLSYNAVHTPMEATEDDLNFFKGHPRQTLAAMTWAVDRAIGSVIDELKSKGIYDNTLIFFLSDNGGAYENKSSNYPLKGVKGTKYEGGIRIPFLVKWGNRFENRTFDGLSSSLDIFTTSLDAAGINYKRVSPKLDGTSLIPFLQNKKSGNPHQYLFFRKDKFSAVIYNNYKVVSINDVDDRMYNLNDGLKEKEDLRHKEPKVYRKIIKAYKDWGKEMKDPLWLEPENWNKVVFLMHDDMLNNRPIKVYNPSQLNKIKK